jgi:(2R)-sulfolactate sulfo-lyase subunit alpha
MRFDVADAAPTDELNRILWHDARGWSTQYPGPSHAIFFPMSVDVRDEDREASKLPGPLQGLRLRAAVADTLAEGGPMGINRRAFLEIGGLASLVTRMSVNIQSTSVVDSGADFLQLTEAGGPPPKRARVEFIVPYASDNVGVVVVDGVETGRQMTGWVLDSEETPTVQAVEPIPLGHKIALRHINSGEMVVEYGLAIGQSIAGIDKGRHVHVHNVKSRRW